MEKVIKINEVDLSKLIREAMNNVMNTDYEDKVPDKRINFNASFISILNHYSAPQVLDAIAKYYSRDVYEQRIANKIEEYSEDLRKLIYNR